ncbi:baseplate J/gp47 family protein [Burkholderia ambifaria]|uniref:baseplate J/gp47 family protein n=1 Tax=Burkholderia ambifaria TaxID=152480 RepID=UPI00158A2BA4|nr:baseplate J/gp47 family protein [Burkholderia ambifaria]
MSTPPTSSVPPINWAPTGPVVPAESAILTGVLTDTNAAFGGNLNIENEDGSPNVTTPQGQLASSLTAIIGAKNDDMLEVSNGVDPDLADGRWQDAIGRIYFIERNPAEPTALQVACVGAASTVIPLGALIKDSSNNVYLCTQAGTIPASGTITLGFACKVTGPTPVPAAGQVSIYQAIPGWDTVSVVSGVVGSDVESRADFEYRRRQSVALNAAGSVPAVRAKVLNVAGVLDACVLDNPLGTSVVNGTYTLAPNSLYVGVYGGAAQDIGNAIWTKKSPGCNYNGNTTVTVQDTSVGSQPYPSYTVKFQVLTAVPILFSVQLVNNPNLPANIVQLVQNAIIAAFTGADGGSRARSNSTIFAGRYYPGVIAIDPSVELLSIQLGTTTANQNSVVMGIDKTPTLTAANIAVSLV